MYAGTQYFGTSKTEIEFLVRHGVNHFDATVPDMEVQCGYWAWQLRCIRGSQKLLQRWTRECELIAKWIDQLQLCRSPGLVDRFVARAALL